MKFKSKPMKVEQQQESHNHHNNHHHHHHHLGSYSSSGSELDLNEAVSSTADPCLSPADLKHLTKLPSPSPISKFFSKIYIYIKNYVIIDVLSNSKVLNLKS